MLKKPKHIIELLVDKIILYDDKMEITYKLNNGSPDNTDRDFLFYTENSDKKHQSPPKIVRKFLTIFCIKNLPLTIIKGRQKFYYLNYITSIATKSIAKLIQNSPVNFLDDKKFRTTPIIALA